MHSPVSVFSAENAARQLRRAAEVQALPTDAALTDCRYAHRLLPILRAELTLLWPEVGKQTCSSQNPRVRPWVPLRLLPRNTLLDRHVSLHRHEIARSCRTVTRPAADHCTFRLRSAARAPDPSTARTMCRVRSAKHADDALAMRACPRIAAGRCSKGWDLAAGATSSEPWISTLIPVRRPTIDSNHDAACR